MKIILEPVRDERLDDEMHDALKIAMDNSEELAGLKHEVRRLSENFEAFRSAVGRWEKGPSVSELQAVRGELFARMNMLFDALNERIDAMFKVNDRNTSSICTLVALAKKEAKEHTGQILTELRLAFAKARSPIDPVPEIPVAVDNRPVPGFVKQECDVPVRDDTDEDDGDYIGRDDDSGSILYDRNMKEAFELAFPEVDGGKQQFTTVNYPLKTETE